MTLSRNQIPDDPRSQLQGRALLDLSGALKSRSHIKPWTSAFPGTAVATSCGEVATASGWGAALPLATALPALGLSDSSPLTAACARQALSKGQREGQGRGVLEGRPGGVLCLPCWLWAQPLQNREVATISQPADGDLGGTASFLLVAPKQEAQSPPRGRPPAQDPGSMLAPRPGVRSGSQAARLGLATCSDCPRST